MIHICIGCDVEGCKQAQGVRFDAHEETFGDLLTACAGLGWVIVGGPAQADITCRCPEHACIESAVQVP
jgi:hypothetical protein